MSVNLQNFYSFELNMRSFYKLNKNCGSKNSFLLTAEGTLPTSQDASHNTTQVLGKTMALAPFLG